MGPGAAPEGTPWWAWVLCFLVAVLAVPIVQAWRESRRARHEVKNSHEVNLRDDIDGKHGEVLEAVADLAEKITGLADGQKRHDSEIRGIRHDLRQDRSSVETVARRLDGHIEETRREHMTNARRLDLHLEQTAPIIRWVEDQQREAG